MDSSQRCRIYIF